MTFTQNSVTIFQNSDESVVSLMRRRFDAAVTEVTDSLRVGEQLEDLQQISERLCESVDDEQVSSEMNGTCEQVTLRMFAD
jgi:hypothetical protein